MPRKRNRKTANGELTRAAGLIDELDQLRAKLADRRDALNAELSEVESLLARLGGAPAPARPNVAAAPRAVSAKKPVRKARAKRSGGPSLGQIVLEALAAGGLSASELYEAVVARRPGTGRNHLQTELFQLGRKGAIKRSGERGSYVYSAR